jgi:aryl-phospho-beta-D-glucosidase BglC (GH1 family)
MRREFLRRVAMLAAGAMLPLPLAGCASSSIEARIDPLGRGINLSHWFAQGSGSALSLRNTYTDEDMQRITGAGLQHVRLPVDPALIFDMAAPGTLQPANLGYLDAAIDRAFAAGLAVIIDIHPVESFVARVRDDDAFVDSFAAAWGALAAHLRPRDPARLFLEIMNEPHFDDSARWNVVQHRLAPAIRAAAPQHTIIATGDDWSAIDGLLQVDPLDDPNVVYNFHFYEPFIFTHQGASWGWEMSRHFLAVPYPSSPEAAERVVPFMQNREAIELLRGYGAERWDAARVAQRIGEAAAWGERHRVRLTCNEFGVYRAVAPPDARNAWIADVRQACERYGIGWSMWDYSANFGLATEVNLRRAIDPATAAALGLQAGGR